MPLTPFASDNDRFHAMKSDYPDRYDRRRGKLTEGFMLLITDFILRISSEGDQLINKNFIRIRFLEFRIDE